MAIITSPDRIESATGFENDDNRRCNVFRRSFFLRGVLLVAAVIFVPISILLAFEFDGTYETIVYVVDGIYVVFLSVLIVRFIAPALRERVHVCPEALVHTEPGALTVIGWKNMRYVAMIPGTADDIPEVRGSAAVLMESRRNGVRGMKPEAVQALRSERVWIIGIRYDDDEGQQHIHGIIKNIYSRGDDLLEEVVNHAKRAGVPVDLEDYLKVKRPNETKLRDAIGSE